MEIIEETDLSKWDRLCKNFDANPFHNPLWLESFQNINRKPIFISFIDANKTIGIASGLQIQSRHRLLHPISKSLFFFSGPIMISDDKNLALKCFKCLKEYAVENDFVRLSINSYDYPYELNIESVGLNKKIREEYIIDIRSSKEDILKRFKRDQQWRVRKAKKSGLIFKEAKGGEAIESLFECMSETKNRRTHRGFGDYSFFFMAFLDQEVIRKLLQRSICHIYHVFKDDEIISSCLLIESGKSAYYLLSGSKKIGYKLGAPAFLVWNVIMLLKDQEYEYLNKGGIMGDASASNLARNKIAVGAERYFCTGGFASDLQNPLINILAKIYNKLC